jgi:serine/threonine-protein kinase HipA
MSVAEVIMWGKVIGAVAWDKEKNIANFEYEPGFVKSGIEISPIIMPLSGNIYSFPGLSRGTFHGLPGLLADSLPDRFGNAVIDAWLAKEGRSPESFNPVERLCYTGKRGMGALEYEPGKEYLRGVSKDINMSALVKLASEILSKRDAFKTSFSVPERKKALQDILRIGTSAGGARAKAVIAWNPETNEIRSGQVDAGEGFSFWVLKFDGVSGNFDKVLRNTEYFGLIEYVYYRMAREAGIEMSESRVMRENGRNHFMTKRFDRIDKGKKVHMQTLGALAHYDYNQPGAYSYEQAIQVIRKLGLPMASVEEQFRRMVFNVMARNQDDHVKNTAFLMDRDGAWKLSPAYDMVHSYNPDGNWTNKHQMSVNGKYDKFIKQDFIDFAGNVSMSRNRALDIFDQVLKAVTKWPACAREEGIPENITTSIADTLRLDW